MERKRILKWEMYGILFISLAGSLLHFTFEFSGFWKPLALISAVNESVWEHFKIGFWPAFIWGVIEFFAFGRRVRNFLLAKGIALTIIPVTIAALFYGYTYLTGTEILAVDISIFIVAIAVAQVVGYRIMLTDRKSPVPVVLGSIMILINVVLFSLLTYFPPKCPVFRDPVSGEYGIVNHSHSGDGDD